MSGEFEFRAVRTQAYAASQRQRDRTISGANHSDRSVREERNLIGRLDLADGARLALSGRGFLCLSVPRNGAEPR